MDARHPVHRETSERKIVALGGRFGFAWITALFFLISLVGHWLFGWFAYVSEQRAHSELAILLHIGSPQSKEGDERKEAKLDAILQRLDPENADKLIRELDVQFHRT